jgi:2Fe-2S ferredoxin
MSKPATKGVRRVHRSERSKKLPKIRYVAVDASERVIDASTSDSVMSTAVKNGVSGILAECGGSSTCGTCHVYVAEEFLSAAGPFGELEEDILEMAVTDRRDNSRLSCQIPVQDELEGLTVFLPAVQP